MSQPKLSPEQSPDLEHFRGYLKVLAISQMPRRALPRFGASDIVQETLFEAHRDWNRFEGTTEQELRAWLRQILVNNLLGALRHARQKKRDHRREIAIVAKVNQSSVCIDKFLAAEQTSPSQGVCRNEHLERLYEALLQLPTEWREAVVLKHLQGHKLTEVAEIMGCSVPATGGLLRRGMARLREILLAG